MMKQMEKLAPVLLLLYIALLAYALGGLDLAMVVVLPIIVPISIFYILKSVSIIRCFDTFPSLALTFGLFVLGSICAYGHGGLVTLSDFAITVGGGYLIFFGISVAVLFTVFSFVGSNRR